MTWLTEPVPVWMVLVFGLAMVCWLARGLFAAGGRGLRRWWRRRRELRLQRLATRISSVTAPSQAAQPTYQYSHSDPTWSDAPLRLTPVAPQPVAAAIAQAPLVTPISPVRPAGTAMQSRPSAAVVICGWCAQPVGPDEGVSCERGHAEHAECRASMGGRCASCA
jgi:hypothetical protein